jgi:hypothetical protein
MSLLNAGGSFLIRENLCLPNVSTLQIKFTALHTSANMKFIRLIRVKKNFSREGCYEEKLRPRSWLVASHWAMFNSQFSILNEHWWTNKAWREVIKKIDARVH